MSTDLFDLTGRRALITGSSQGIGFALAHGMAAAGTGIVLNGRDTEKLTAAAKALREGGATVDILAFDVTDHNAARAAVDGFDVDRIVAAARLTRDLVNAPANDLGPAELAAALGPTSPAGDGVDRSDLDSLMEQYPDA